MERTLSHKSREYACPLRQAIINLRIESEGCESQIGRALETQIALQVKVRLLKKSADPV